MAALEENYKGAAEVADGIDEPDGNVDSDGFISAIGRRGFGDLDKEPKRLQETIEQIDHDINTLSIEHYDVHIHNARCLDAIEQGCETCVKDTVGVRDVLPELAGELKRFRNVGRKISEAYSRNLQTMDHYVQLLELLEIPQLMDTCARNNLYDEALHLFSYVSTLQKRHLAISNIDLESSKGELERPEDEEQAEKHPYSGGTSIINVIAEEVYESAAHMRKQLLQQLRQQINYPTCLRIISFLRRLDREDRVRRNHLSTSQRDEYHFRFEFLDCRDAYIKSLTTEDQSSYYSRPYQSSLKLIERCRVNWFDIITQYRAIFASGDDILQELSEDGGILARWVSGKVMDFLSTLDLAISNIDDFGALANVLEQAMKFGLSLARVGSDFRPLLMEPFKNRVVQLMVEFWDDAVERAESKISEGEWGAPLPVPNSKNTGRVGENANQNKERGNGEEEGFLDEEDAFQVESLTPPNDLLEFPVIAELTNLVLSSFNELRQCASPVFGMELGNILINKLGVLQVAFSKYKGLPEQVQPVERYNKICTATAKVFLPYVQKCFDALFDKPSFSPELRTFLNITTLQSGVLDLLVQPPVNISKEPIGTVTNNHEFNSEPSNTGGQELDLAGDDEINAEGQDLNGNHLDLAGGEEEEELDNESGELHDNHNTLNA